MNPPPEETTTARRRPARGRGHLGVESPLLGGPVEAPANAGSQAPVRPPPADFTGSPDVLEFPSPARRGALGGGPQLDPRRLRELLPALEPSREVDDWGRSQHMFDLIEPLLNFYYRYWFRVEQQGITNVPSRGGALLVSNHAGALPPDAPMIMQAISHEHPRPRPLYMLGEHWFKGYPGASALTSKIGLVPAHPANAQRLLSDEGRLAVVFPEGLKGSGKLFYQRYKLRRFGRGGFVKSAIRAQVPIVPIAVVGAEEAAPIFAHVRALQRLTGLPYFPLNHAFPHLGLLAPLLFLPAKFRIRFLEPVSMEGYGPDDAEDLGLVQSIAEDVRGRIQSELDRMVSERSSVWFG